MRRALFLLPIKTSVGASIFSKRWCQIPTQGAPIACSRKESPEPIESVEDNDLTKKLQQLSESDQNMILSALRNPNQHENKLGGSGIGTKNADMLAAFTCGKCDFRTVKMFSKHAYTKGIVIVECPNCCVRHLLADNLGWFVDEARNIEEILKEKGESFIRIGNDLMVDPEDEPENPIA